MFIIKVDISHSYNQTFTSCLTRLIKIYVFLKSFAFRAHDCCIFDIIFSVKGCVFSFP